MTQSALASAAGCRQSAVSMMERGREDALSYATLEKIAELLGVELPADFAPVASHYPVTGAGRGYCPAFDCPSNSPYVVGGELFLLPSLDSGGKYCRYCGELLEFRCPGCGSPVGDGACCVLCGAAYVSSEGLDIADPLSWADKQRSRIRELKPHI